MPYNDTSQSTIKKLCLVNYQISLIMNNRSCGDSDFRRAHKRLVNVYITFTIAFRIDSECPFIERLVLVKTFSYPLLNVT